MAHIRMTSEDASGGKALYAESIRAKVETEENIGKMVIVDIETGDYEIENKVFEASRRLRSRNPDAKLFGIPIGYKIYV